MGLVLGVCFFSRFRGFGLKVVVVGYLIGVFRFFRVDLG